MIFRPSRLRHAAALSIISLLGACGGGDLPSEPADKYVGTWAGACVDLSAVLMRPNSYKNTLTLRKISASSYDSAASNIEWANGTCTGASTPIAGESGSTIYTIVGTKAVGADTVDKVTYPTGVTTSAKTIALVNAAGTTLQLGDPGAVDADGFPVALAPTVYTKQ